MLVFLKLTLSYAEVPFLIRLTPQIKGMVLGPDARCHQSVDVAQIVLYI